MSADNPEQMGLTRRELLTRGGILAGGMVIGDLLIGDSPVRLAESAHTPYESGDSIKTAFGDVEIDGWNVLIPQELTEGAEASGTTVSFQLMDASKEKELSSNGSGSFIATIERDSEYIDVLTINPKTTGEPVSLVLTATEKDSGRTTGDVFMIQPTVYTEAGAEFGQEVANFGSIIAEEPIGADNFKIMEKISKQFEKFVSPSTVYLYKGKEKRESDSTVSGGTNSSRGWIEMSTASFTDPVYKGEGLGTVFHEWAHDIMRELLETHGDQLPAHELNMAFGPIADTYYHEPSNGQLTLTEVLTESTYIKIAGEKMGASQAGHPQDNPDEMFASTLTIMRFHHRGFLEQFKKLDAEGQQKIAKFVKATLNALSAFNNSKGDLRELIPEIDEIKETVLAD